jgi:hypothetical protein
LEGEEFDEWVREGLRGHDVDHLCAEDAFQPGDVDVVRLGRETDGARKHWQVHAVLFEFLNGDEM